MYCMWALTLLFLQVCCIMGEERRMSAIRMCITYVQSIFMYALKLNMCTVFISTLIKICTVLQQRMLSLLNTLYGMLKPCFVAHRSPQPNWRHMTRFVASGKFLLQKVAQYPRSFILNRPSHLCLPPYNWTWGASQAAVVGLNMMHVIMTLRIHSSSMKQEK